MENSLRLPPSTRDFEIYCAVAFNSVSTHRAADKHGVSQTRVRQIVTHVGDWVADNLPDWGEADQKKQLRLAQHVAANRLEHQYEQAMLYWSAESDPKYLRQATRIALAQARLGVVAGRIHALAAQSSRHTPCAVAPTETRCVSKGPNDTSAAEPLSAAATIDSSPLPPVPCRLTPVPSVRDCSPLAIEAAPSDAPAAAGFALNPSPESDFALQRHHSEEDVAAMAFVERRLLTLIENQGSTNPDKVAQLEETLANVRRSKAAAELRLSRFLPGVQIQPLTPHRSPLTPHH